MKTEGPKHHSEPAADQRESGAFVPSAANQITVFRIIDVLFGINQACSEAVVQLRISHLYQLQKDRKSLFEKLFLVVIAAATIIPTLDHLFPVSRLKWPWIVAVVLFVIILFWLEKDSLLRKKGTREEYEDAEKLDQLVKKDQATLMGDYVSSYVTRHDMIYHAYNDSEGPIQQSLRSILDSYQPVFEEMINRLTKLMNERPPRLDQETYNELVSYIDTCEKRYRELDQSKGGQP